MKRMICLLAAVVLLSGCAAKEAQAVTLDVGMLGTSVKPVGVIVAGILVIGIVVAVLNKTVGRIQRTVFLPE